MKHKLLLLFAISLFSVIFSTSVDAQSSSNRIRSISWSRDGNKIAFSRNDGTVQILSTITGQTLFSLQGNTTGTTAAVAFSTDANSSKLASGGADGVVKIWNSNTGSLLLSLTGYPSVIVGLAWSPTNPNLVASVSFAGLMRVWDTSNSNLIFSVSNVGEGYDLKWSPDGTKLVTTDGFHLVTWNATNGAKLSTLVPNNLRNDGLISSVDWGNNVNLLVSATNLGTMRTWNPTTGATVTTFTGYTSGINAVRFSPDGSKIASVGYDSNVKVWNSSIGQLINTIPTTSVPFAVAWSPDGSRIAYGGDSGIIQMVNLNPDLIFADGFESGSFAAWTSSTTGGGDLSVQAAAALLGTQGMQAVLNDNTSIYVTDDTPNAEVSYRARFYFDPNSILMAEGIINLNGDAHYIFYGYSGTATVVMRIEFGISVGVYRMRTALLDDLFTWTTSNWFTITDAPHFIEIWWKKSTAAGANNGSLSLWIDGTQQANVTGVDNDTRRIDRVRLGATAGVDNGTRGTYYFDAFESRRQTYIGPAY